MSREGAWEPKEEWLSSGALEGILSCPERREGEKEVQKSLRTSNSECLESPSLGTPSLLLYTSTELSHHREKAFHGFHWLPHLSHLHFSADFSSCNFFC